MYKTLEPIDQNTPDFKDDSDERLEALKKDIHCQLIAGMDLTLIETMDDQELREEMRRGATELCDYRGELLPDKEREKLVDEIIDETLGLGPLEKLLRDPTISDILINGPRTVYVERNGRLERSNVSFYDDDHLITICQRIASRVGRRLDESSPMVDARLEDGSRVNAVIRPLALDGALLSIRRFPEHALMAEDLIANESITEEMIEFLAGCVRARLNIVISGGTGSGKTTFLNMLSAYISEDERVATIEDAAELRLQQPHVARMETRPANIEGHGEITSRDLLRNSLRMRPDRIIIGECRGPEAFDMLQAMNTGHDGSLTTIHANDTREAVSRLEMLVGMAGFEIPILFIHKMIASAVQIVIQARRLSGGSRKITQISEITGMQGEVIGMHDIFVFNQTGVNKDGAALGEFEATGIRPQCLDRFKSAGIELPLEMFERKTLSFDGASHFNNEN
ncbi:MAG: CpaF family protein [Planctomycetes bacterium]|nr:CpaF family protein [Planctomycetota bacterium]